MRVNLLKTIQLDPEKTEAKLKLSKLHLLFNDIDKASKEIENILIKTPGQLDALAIKASILIRQKKTKDALTIINDILSKDANHIEAVSLKVVLLIRDKSLNQALELLIPALEKHSDNISLNLLKIQLDSQRNDIEAIINDYETLSKLKPENIQIKLTLAKVYQKANKPQKAEQILNHLIETNPTRINIKLLLLNLFFSTDEDRALSKFDHFIKQQQNNHKNIITFSKWLVIKNKLAKAKKTLDQAISNQNITDKNKVPLNLLAAEIAFKNNNTKQAFLYIDKVLLDDIDNVNAKILKAKIQISQAKYAAAKELLKEVLWQKPNIDSALSLLAGINELQGDLDKATTNYRNALKSNPANKRAISFIVNKEIAENHTDYAIEILERALRSSSSQLMLLTKLVELNINEKKWDVANSYIGRIQGQKNGQLLAEYFNGTLLQQQSKYQKAITAYKTVLEKAPWIKDAYSKIVDCYLQLNQQQQLTVYLNELIEKNPDIIFPYLWKSQQLSSNKKYTKAISLMQKVLKQKKIKEPVIYIELGRLYSLVKDKASEQKIYLQGLQQSPNNINLMLNLASSYETKQDFDSAIILYKKILLINPQHNVSKNNMATLLLDHYGKTDDINKAIQLVKSFKQSNQPYFLDTYGWAKLKSGKATEALAIFKRVILLEPDTLIFRYHLGVAYYNEGDLMSAAAELKQSLYIGKNKNFPEKVLIKNLLVKIKD